MEDTVSQVALNQENIILPRLDLLYESHTDLVSQLKGHAKNEDLTDLGSTVHILVDATKRLNQELETVKDDIVAIKKAL